MADLAISALPIAGGLTGAELLPLVQGGVTSQSTVSAILSYISGSLTATNGLTKTGNNIVWGGALTGNTSITGSYTLNFANNFVGINTATQSALLERLRVNGVTRFDDTVYVSDQGYFSWSPGTSFLVASISQHLYLSADAAKDIVFLNNGSESARIFSDNNMSIGYGVAVTARLQTVGSTTDSSAYAFKVFDSAISEIIGVRNDGYTYFSRLTASTVPYIDASNRLVSSAVTPTELGLLSGITGFTGSGTLIAKGTSPTFTTDITTPLIIGGSAVGSQLNLKSTSASGTSTVAGINFLVGNNGATTAGSVYNSGQVNIGNYASPTNLRIFTVGQDTAFVSIGSRVTSTGSGAIYFCSGTPSNSNWGISSDGSGMEIQAMATDGTFNIRTGNTIRLQLTGVKTSGAITGETHTLSDNTNQTLSTAIPKVLFTLGSTQWATGALAATQKFFSITQPTISFVGASTATLVATVGIAGAPIQGTNATNTTSVGLLIEAGAITGATTSYGAYFNAQTGGSTNYALGLAGDLRFPAGNATISGSNGIMIQSSSGSNVTLNAGSTSATCAIIYAQGTERFRFNTGTSTSGAVTVMTVSPANNTGQTASTEISGVLYNSYSRQWATGAITTQREQYVSTVTYTAVGASVITSAYGMYVEAPTASTNITITNNWALGLSGALYVNSANSSIFDNSAGSNTLRIQRSSGAVETIITSNSTGSFIGSSTAHPTAIQSAGVTRFSFAGSGTGDCTVTDTVNFVFSTGTGTKLGTATTQKIGFWNATPIVQPTTGVTAATFMANTSGIVDDTASFDGYTIGQVVKALRNIGLLA